MGVSVDTLRRWADSGRIAVTTGPDGRRLYDGADLAALATQLAGQPGAAPAMDFVFALVATPRIVTEGTQFDHVRGGARARGQKEAVVAHARPVRRPMVARPVDLELRTQMGEQFVAENSWHASVLLRGQFTRAPGDVYWPVSRLP